MTGEKMARIRRCNGSGGTPCDYFRNNPGGWQWPRCFFQRDEELAVAASLAIRIPPDPVGCVLAVQRAMAATPPELDNAMLEGPASNCAAGYWDDLAPVDLEAERAAKVRAAAETFCRQMAPILSELDAPSLVSKLAEMVASGNLNPDVAVAVAQARGIDPDAEMPAVKATVTTGQPPTAI